MVCPNCTTRHRSKKAKEACRKKFIQLRTNATNQSNLVEDFPQVQENSNPIDENVIEEEDQDSYGQQYDYNSYEQNLSNYRQESSHEHVRVSPIQQINSRNLPQDAQEHLTLDSAKQLIEIGQTAYQMDLDSVLINIKPQSLYKIVAWKVTLGATAYRQIGDEVSKEMTLLMTSFPSVYVATEHCESIRQRLRQHGVPFRDGSSTKSISKYQVNIASHLVIQILKDLNVDYVRIVDHGLKLKSFKNIFTQLKIVQSADNRIDIGFVQEDPEHISFYAKKSSNKSHVWPFLTHFEGGGITMRRQNVDYKAYSTLVHHIKAGSRFSEPTPRVLVKSAQTSIKNIEECVKGIKEKAPKMGTRFQVSLHGAELSIQRATEELIWLHKYLNQNFWTIKITLQSYFHNLFSVLRQSEELGIFNTDNSRELSDGQLRYYATLVSLMGWSSKFTTRQIKKVKNWQYFIDPDTFIYQEGYVKLVQRQCNINRNTKGQFQSKKQIES